MQANWQTKLSMSQMLEIIEIRAPHIGKRLSADHPASVVELARVYGVSPWVISTIAHKKKKILEVISDHVATYG